MGGKDYGKWHSKKTEINEIEKRPFFHEREIWFCYLGSNVGFEEDGSGKDFLRPIVIVRKFSKEIFWGVPLTNSEKKDAPYYFSFSFARDSVVKRSTALLSQIRLIDSKRLSYQIGEISEENQKTLIEKLKGLFP
jgi:mRNA interferase MazF